MKVALEPRRNPPLPVASVPPCPRCRSAASVRLLSDSSGGTRLRRSGRRTRDSSWASAQTWYCRSCHAELHLLTDGDWQVDLIGSDGTVARTVYLAPADAGAVGYARAWLRAALSGGRQATWRELVANGAAAGHSEHTLRRARAELGLRGRWTALGVYVWAFGHTSAPFRPGKAASRKAGAKCAQAGRPELATADG